MKTVPHIPSGAGAQSPPGPPIGETSFPGSRRSRWQIGLSNKKANWQGNLFETHKPGILAEKVPLDFPLHLLPFCSIS